MRVQRESTAIKDGTFYGRPSENIAGAVWLCIDSRSGIGGAQFTIADLDAIIAGLTDLRDRMRAQ